jgi:PAS domain S-box-containing protein
VAEVQALLDLAAMVEREISESSAVQRYIAVAERERRRRRDLQLLLDHSPVVAFIKDEEGRLRYVNRQFEEMFGWALDEVRGKTDAAWAPADVARQLAANDRAALNANEPQEDLESVPIPGGGMRDWLVFRFPYVRESGERVLGGVAVDMTEQQEMQAALHRSEERYRTLFEGASDIVCSLGRDGRLLHANPAWKKTFGPPQTAAGAVSIFDFIHRNSQEECEALLERARKGENALPWKAQFVALGGQILHLAGNANCSYTDGKKLEVIRLILRDVSTSDGEAREHSGDDRFVVAARHGTFLVYEWRISSGEVHWHGDIDAALRCKSGAWPRTFDGRKQALHPEDRDRVLAEIDDHLSRRTPFVSEYRVICRDGSVRHWTERGEARRDGAGHPTLWVGAILDITPQKEAEAALITARDAAERAGKTKSHFLAILSHEVRTPVNSVLGVSGLLLEKDLSLEARPLVEMVQHSAEHLLAVVGDVLDFSKIEAGQLTLEAIDFDLGAVVNELVTVHGINARARRLSLEASIDRHAPRWVRGDPVRLRQVLGNLIDNAIKFSEVGRIKVRVAAKTKEDGNTEVTFAVSDQGIGIAADATLRIFEPFEQGDAQTSQR